MSHFEELDMNELEQVTGGAQAPIQTGGDQPAGVWKNFEDIATKKASGSLVNGTVVNVVGAPRFNEAKGRNYVQIEYLKKGVVKTGWVAASIVGLGR